MDFYQEFKIINNITSDELYLSLLLERDLA
jgi:hypothetical protein